MRLAEVLHFVLGQRAFLFPKRASLLQQMKLPQVSHIGTKAPPQSSVLLQLALGNLLTVKRHLTAQRPRAVERERIIRLVRFGLVERARDECHGLHRFEESAVVVDSNPLQIERVEADGDRETYQSSATL